MSRPTTAAATATERHALAGALLGLVDARADVSLTNGVTGALLLVDVSVTHPGTGENLAAAAEVDGAAAAKRAMAKDKKYAALVNNPRSILSYVVETGGRVHDGGVVTQLVRAALGLLPGEKSVAYARAVTRMRTWLSVVHWRFVGRGARKMIHAVRRRADGGGALLPPSGAGGLGGGVGQGGVGG